jgi:hypothetical protein
MVSMSTELKERNILKLILIVRFACATLDVGHPISSSYRIEILIFLKEILAIGSNIHREVKLKKKKSC